MNVISTSTFITTAAHAAPQQQVISAVMFYVCIREVLGLNLCWNSSYPHWSFSWFFSDSPNKSRLRRWNTWQPLTNSCRFVIYQSYCCSRHI